MTTATKRKSAEEGGEVFDRELVDLPRELRWRTWMGRIEAVLFASASPVVAMTWRAWWGRGPRSRCSLRTLRRS